MSTAAEQKGLRQQADLVSVDALADLLRRVASEPRPHLKEEALRLALRSQGAMAKHASPELKIHGMSLNHQKRVAELALGSYEVLDALRNAAREALSAAAEPTERGHSKSKQRLSIRVMELKAENTLLKQDLYLLQRAYDLRCLHARNYAKAAGGATEVRCSKEQKELDASFSLRRKPVVATKVTQMEEARKRARPTS